jgi:hypothetical protein
VRADVASPARAASRPATKLARARSGAVCDSSAIAWSSATAGLASSSCPCSTQARTFSSSAAMRSVRFDARQPAQVPLGQIGAAGVIAAIEHHVGAADRRRADATHAIEERHRSSSFP